MTIDPTRNWQSVAVVAQRANVSTKTVKNWIRAGLVEACRTAGGALRVDLEQWATDAPRRAPGPPRRQEPED